MHVSASRATTGGTNPNLFARFNAKNQSTISAQYADSIDSAKEKLFHNKFDAAIIDIRLKSQDGTKDALTNGNEVRDIILASELLIVAHVTGEPKKVSISNPAHQDLIRVFEKGDSTEDAKPFYEKVLDWINDNEEMLNALSSSKSIIKEKIADLFFSSVWPRWEHWTDNKDLVAEHNFLPSSLSRHISSHLYHDLLEGSDGKVHPEEWYFLPPRRDRFHTGDIFFSDRELYVVITPRCDLERKGQGDSILSAKLEDISTDWQEKKSKLHQDIKAIQEQEAKAVEEGNMQKADKQRNKIDRLYDNFRSDFFGHKRNKNSLHFLPLIRRKNEADLGPFFVNFDQITSFEYGSISHAVTF